MMVLGMRIDAPNGIAPLVTAELVLPGHLFPKRRFLGKKSCGISRRANLLQPLFDTRLMPGTQVRRSKPSVRFAPIADIRGLNQNVRFRRVGTAALRSNYRVSFERWCNIWKVKRARTTNARRT